MGHFKNQLEGIFVNIHIQASVLFVRNNKKTNFSINAHIETKLLSGVTFGLVRKMLHFACNCLLKTV